MDTFSAVIDALGIAGVSEILGITDSHARTLKARNSIPPAYFKRLVDSDAGQANGITYDVLYGLLDRTSMHREAAPTPTPEVAA